MKDIKLKSQKKSMSKERWKIQPRKNFPGTVRSVREKMARPFVFFLSDAACYGESCENVRCEM